MKMLAYSVREDERAFFKAFGEKYHIEVEMSSDPPTEENAGKIPCDCVSIITTPVTAKVIEAWHACGVRCISTRTIGYEHIDLKKAGELNIPVTNAPYTPNTVADYAIMMILMLLRKMKPILNRYIGQDFGLEEIRGRELQQLTVGVVGTGKIGAAVLRHLSGFGCRLMASDLYPREELKQIAEYVTLEDLFARSDVITFHAPATEESFHMVNRESLAQMKDGVVLVNTARGSLIDTDALIEALETGKVGAAGLDVVENEQAIYYNDYKYRPVCHHQMSILSAMPNVLMTPHTAFFTDQAVSDMVEHSIAACAAELTGKPDPYRVS